MMSSSRIAQIFAVLKLKIVSRHNLVSNYDLLIDNISDALTL
jgi:hypothetical protein